MVPTWTLLPLHQLFDDDEGPLSSGCHGILHSAEVSEQGASLSAEDRDPDSSDCGELDDAVLAQAVAAVTKSPANLALPSGTVDPLAPVPRHAALGSR